MNINRRTGITLTKFNKRVLNCFQFYKSNVSIAEMMTFNIKILLEFCTQMRIRENTDARAKSDRF